MFLIHENNYYHQNKRGNYSIMDRKYTWGKCVRRKRRSTRHVTQGHRVRFTSYTWKKWAVFPIFNSVQRIDKKNQGNHSQLLILSFSIHISIEATKVSIFRYPFRRITQPLFWRNTSTNNVDLLPFQRIVGYIVDTHQKEN